MSKQITVDGKSLSEWVHEEQTQDAKEVYGETVVERNKMRARSVAKKGDSLHRPPKEVPECRQLSREEIDDLYPKPSRFRWITVKSQRGRPASRDNAFYQERDRKFLELLSKQSKPIRLEHLLSLLREQNGGYDYISSPSGRYTALRLSKTGKIRILNRLGDSPGMFLLPIQSRAETPDRKHAVAQLREGLEMVARALEELQLGVNIRIEAADELLADSK